MMKQRYKSAIVQTALFSLLASPTFVFAEDAITSSPENTGSHFCASLDVTTQKIALNLIEKEGKYTSKEKDREIRLEEKVGARERSKQSVRLDTEATHDKVFAKLIEHATSPNEKTAILKFRQELDIAISKRRTSVDAAVAIFKTESAKLIASREHGIDNATATLRNATIKAGNVAKVNCKNGLAGTTVRNRYTRDLKNARIQFQADVASALKRNEELSLLIKNRDADIKKAVEVFKDTLAALRLDLESSLKAN